MTRFRLGELFSGPGGLAWGALHANIPGMEIEHVWATDYDLTTCQTYTKNICPKKPDSVICSDIRTLDFQRLHDISEIDGLAFGFPCNDYSIVGESKGLDGTFGPLYSYGVKALKDFKPKWFVAENVGGLRSANKGSAFTKILNEFQDCGYKLYPNLYKFEEYGIPQSRHRIIIIGIRNDIDVEFKIPSPEIYQEFDVSARTALEVPPIFPWVKNNEPSKISETVKKRLQYIKPGKNAFNSPMPEEVMLHCGKVTLSQIYRRLDPDKPAYTVTGSGGGGTHMYHWSEDRPLTNREKARLQTFPDSFEFCGNITQVRKQVGMAVPCVGAKIIFEAILKSFNGIPYECVESNIKF